MVGKHLVPMTTRSSRTAACALDMLGSQTKDGFRTVPGTQQWSQRVCTEQKVLLTVFGL